MTGNKVDYPMIGDPQLKVAKLYDMLPADAGDTSEGRTAADNATVRSVFVIGPDKKIKLSLTYPMTTGRNFDEILRAIDSIQLTAKHQVATPAQVEAGRGRDRGPLGQRRGREEALRQLREGAALSAPDQDADRMSTLAGRISQTGSVVLRALAADCGNAAFRGGRLRAGG